MEAEVDKELGIIEGEETASSSFFSELNRFAKVVKGKNKIDSEEEEETG
jgi:hypothetical protein